MPGAASPVCCEGELTTDVLDGVPGLVVAEPVPAP